MIKVIVVRSNGHGYYRKSFSSIEETAGFILKDGVFGRVSLITGITLKERSILRYKVNSLWVHQDT